MEDVVKKILEQLPEPRDISEEQFNVSKQVRETWLLSTIFHLIWICLQKIKNRISKKPEDGWLLCFYIGHATDFDVLLKQLPTMLKDVNLGKQSLWKLTIYNCTVHNFIRSLIFYSKN